MDDQAEGFWKTGKPNKKRVDVIWAAMMVCKVNDDGWGKIDM